MSSKLQNSKVPPWGGGDFLADIYCDEKVWPMLDSTGPETPSHPPPHFYLLILQR